MNKETENQRQTGGRIITLHEAAVMLHASYSTVLRMAASGELPAFRMRNAWRTSDVAIREFVKKSMQEQQAFSRSVEV